MQTKTRIMSTLACTVAVLALIVTSQQAAALGLDIKAMYTERNVEGKWSSGVNSYGGYGISADLRLPVIPFDITGAVFFINSETGKTVGGVKESHKLSGREWHLGIMRGFAPIIEVVRPYVGGGIAGSDITYSIARGSNKTSEDFSDSGYWGGAGVQANFLSFQVSYDYRRTFFPKNESGRSLSGTSQSLTFGFRY